MSTKRTGSLAVIMVVTFSLTVRSCIPSIVFWAFDCTAVNKAIVITAQNCFSVLIMFLFSFQRFCLIPFLSAVNQIHLRTVFHLDLILPNILGQGIGGFLIGILKGLHTPSASGTC